MNLVQTCWLNKSQINWKKKEKLKKHLDIIIIIIIGSLKQTHRWDFNSKNHRNETTEIQNQPWIINHNEKMTLKHKKLKMLGQWGECIYHHLFGVTGKRGEQRDTG